MLNSSFSNDPLLAHLHHSHPQPQKTVPAPPEKESAVQSQASPIIIKMDAQSQIQNNNFWGLGEGIFVLLVIFPLLLSCLKKLIHP